MWNNIAFHAIRVDFLRGCCDFLHRKIVGRVDARHTVRGYMEHAQMIA